MADRKNKDEINLGPRYQKKQNKSFVDQDYFHKLSPEERRWMSKFIGSYYNNECVTGTTEQRRATYARFNAANRDFYSRGMRCEVEMDAPTSSLEEAIIELIDQKVKESLKVRKKQKNKAKD